MLSRMTFSIRVYLLHLRAFCILNSKSNYIDECSIDINKSIDDNGGVIPTWGFGIKELINLTGGIPSQEIQELELRISSTTCEAMDISVKTNLYEVERVINLTDGIISNTHMYVFDQQKQIGTRLFCNQVIAAKLRRFREIQTFAMGRDSGESWTGFYAWGRLGYQMILNDDTRFLQMMTTEGRPETNLWELLSTEEGKSFWLDNGFSWMGQFILDDDSLAMQQLRSYLYEKGLSFLSENLP